MKVDTKCFDEFKITVEAYKDIDLEEGVHYKVFGSGEIAFLGMYQEQLEQLCEFYNDAWLAALTTRKL